MLTLAVLAAAAVVLLILLARVRKQRAKTIYHRHFAANQDRERMLYASVAFCVTFAGVRVLTHMIHAGLGPFHDVSMGGRHIHHLVWGILMLLMSGYAWLLQPSQKARVYAAVVASLYGIGSALTLDEFALWLNLRDVYWEREGRASIDAVILFTALLAIGVFGGRFFHELTSEAIGDGTSPDASTSVSNRPAGD